MDLIKPDSYTHNFSIVSIGFDDVEAWCDDAEAAMVTPEILHEVTERMRDDLNEKYYEQIKYSFEECLDAVLTDLKLK